MSKLLEIVHGNFGYEGVPIVSDVNFTLSAGEFVILEGANGAGKSTFIRSILGTLSPISGEIIWTISPNEISYIPQDMTLDPSAPATALDVVLTAFPRGGRKVKERAKAALKQVGLEERTTHRYGTLSGGQRRRVLFARALATDPLCLILDEPTANMDSATENELGRLLHRMVKEENRTVLTTSHVTEWVNHSRSCKIESGRFHG